ncbi:hypothetical protein [Aquabacterium sp. J223]|uniref:hypothetical protein n=1 Tax=Aquabacterium sp. J223 TaxID=2898431 RepID=UPI0021AE19BD|nr:hypothetical protein [Aquabacterium sp. J223]UUX97169.1 hypothetical protein LRS07_07985 [Aquabacterium sp. J223]
MGQSFSYPAPDGWVSVGDGVAGTFSFDPQAVPSALDVYGATYNAPAALFQITVNGNTFTPVAPTTRISRLPPTHLELGRGDSNAVTGPSWDGMQPYSAWISALNLSLLASLPQLDAELFGALDRGVVSFLQFSPYGYDQRQLDFAIDHVRFDIPPHRFPSPPHGQVF